MDVGIHLDDDVERLRSTLQGLELQPEVERVYLLHHASDCLLHARLECFGGGQSRWIAQGVRTMRQGGATAFNALLETSDAAVVAFVESGVHLVAGALGHLAKALAGDVAWASPSTYLVGAEGQGLEGAASGDDFATFALTPVHAIESHCMVVQRAVMVAMGGADDAYDPGPGWERDLAVRASRAGWGVGVKSTAHAHRLPRSPTRCATEDEFRLASQRRFQERFCRGFLERTKREHCPSCEGECCPDFAPPTSIAKTAAAGPLRRVGFAAVPKRPKVSCILPTRAQSALFVEAVRGFLAQDYPHRELIVVDDGERPVGSWLPVDERIRYFRLPKPRPLGAKRNFACEQARGELIAHVDDDSWYPPHRLTTQVNALLQSDAAVCGTSHLGLLDMLLERAWHFGDPRSAGVAGTTMLYRRSHWALHRFQPLAVGDDWRYWQQAFAAARVLDLRTPELCIAMVRPGNLRPHEADVSPAAERTCCKALPYARLRDRLAKRAEAYAAAARGRVPSLPLVSCMMPTSDRPNFVPLALEKLRAQDYPHYELIVVDDGSAPVGSLLDGMPGVTYVRLERRQVSIGEKRALCCAQAHGELIGTWDDDDWYSPGRLRCQVLPIFYDEADMTGLRCDHLLCLPDGDVWSVDDEVHRRMFESDVAGGTIVFRRSLLDHIQFPPIGLAEDAAFIRMARARGYRLQAIRNHGAFAYVRHPRNTWRFEPGQFHHPQGWTRTTLPAELQPEVLLAHQRACRSWLAEGSDRIRPST